MYASPIVLIFSTPCRSASSSKRENTRLRTSTTCSGGRVSAKAVNPTMSANNTVTSNTVPVPGAPGRYASAELAGRGLRQAVRPHQHDLALDRRGLLHDRLDVALQLRARGRVGQAALHQQHDALAALAARALVDREGGGIAAPQPRQLLDRPFEVLRPHIAAVHDDQVLAAPGDGERAVGQVAEIAGIEPAVRETPRHSPPARRNSPRRCSGPRTKIRPRRRSGRALPSSLADLDHMARQGRSADHEAARAAGIGIRPCRHGHMVLGEARRSIVSTTRPWPSGEKLTASVASAMP